jgi:hypothetical protein
MPNGTRGRETFQKRPSTASDNILAALIQKKSCLSNIRISNYKFNGKCFNFLFHAINAILLPSLETYTKGKLIIRYAATYFGHFCHFQVLQRILF